MHYRHSQVCSLCYFSNVYLPLYSQLNLNPMRTPGLLPILFIAILLVSGTVPGMEDAQYTFVKQYKIFKGSISFHL